MRTESFSEWYGYLNDDIKRLTKKARLEGIKHILVDSADMTYTICLKNGYGVNGSDEDTIKVCMLVSKQIVKALKSIQPL